MVVRPRLVIMAKQAVLGRVKTRLGREIGQVEALRFYRATRNALILRVMRDPRFATVLAVDPAHASADCGVRARIIRVGQVRGDLGLRMQALVALKGAQPVIVVGTDIPDIRAGHVADAFRRLRGARVVMGPAPDGGFWLYGARKCPVLPSPFDGVRWSHAATLGDVKRNLGGRGIVEAETLSDVDCAADLAPLKGAWGRVV